MPLIPYEPMRYLENFRRDIDRFFGETGRAYLPDLRVDVYETEKEVIASCEIPGLESKENIAIDIRDNTLELRGTLQRAREGHGENIHRRERYSGGFQRLISLPRKVSAEGSRASYRNGILEVIMPKAEQEPRRSRVEIEFH